VGAGRQIDEQYVATGKVRFVYRNLVVIGDESYWAGEAAYCAGDQGKFWEYHDQLFASQAGENKGAFSKANLKRFAHELGLETGAFNTCLDGNRYSKRVRDETAEGTRRGARSTPTFFVNDQKIEGAQPFEIFRAAIEAELRKAK